MSDLSFYYSKFEHALRTSDTNLADEFLAIYRNKSPREVFLWLEGLRVASRLPAEVESLLTDFYWQFL